MESISLTKAMKRLWQPPRTHGETVENRRVSFLELFYDLVYVVLIAAAAHNLADDLRWVAVGEFIVVFSLVWIAWVSGHSPAHSQTVHATHLPRGSGASLRFGQVPTNPADASQTSEAPAIRYRYSADSEPTHAAVTERQERQIVQSELNLRDSLP